MEGGNNTPAVTLTDVELYRASLAAGSLYPGGDVPIMPEEMAREKQEQELTAEEREERAFTCLLLVQKHMQSHRDVFKQVIQEKSPELGMRQDDILVALMHSMWSSCYNTSMSMDSKPLSSLSSKEIAALLTPQTPNTRFSQQMLQELDRAIEQLAGPGEPETKERLSDGGPSSAVSSGPILKDVGGDSSETAPRRRVSEGPVRGPALRCARDGPLRAS
ncbi:hypothetical protein Esti_003600 [Eimeria stiedai]